MAGTGTGTNVNQPSGKRGDLGALAGAIVAGVGGLFAVGVARAVIYKDFSVIFRFPMLGMVCLLLSGPIGWLLGARLGPLLGERFHSRACEITGGIFGGLLPVCAVLFLGWYLAVPH